MRRYLTCLLAIAACSDDPASSRDSSDDATGEIDGIPTIATDATLVDDAETDARADTDERADTDSGADTTEGIDIVVEHVPPSIYLTIAEIPPSMNGSEPSGELTWRYRANRAHVSLDVVATFSSGEITSASIACLANGQDHLLPTPVEVAPGHWRSMIDDDSAFPDGADVVCTASALGPGGVSEPAHYSFDAVTLPPSLDPFPAVDEWLVVLSRDIFDLVVTPGPNNTAALRSDYLANGNGFVDFDEPFYELGVFSRDNDEAKAIVKAHLLSKIRAELYRVYGLDEHGNPQPGSVPIRIWFEGDEGAPRAEDFGGPRRFSMIALGGDGELADQGSTFGRAQVDWNNQDIEDDTVLGLGVFPTALCRQVLALDVGAILLEAYRPRTGGLAFGEDPDDMLFLGQDLTADDMPAGSSALNRIDVYNLFINFGSLGLASILAHEIGHSLGLVPFGLPPEGLFAGEETDFIVSIAPDAHIDIDGLNIMQTGGSVNWLEAVSGVVPAFEPFSWAYLTRQIVVGELP